MSYLDRIQTCNNADLSILVEWLVEGECYGYVYPEFAEHLLAHPSDTFVAEFGGLMLNESLKTYDQRTEAVAAVLRDLRKQKIVKRNAHEPYPVSHYYGAKSQFEIDRGAKLLFGMHSSGVHMNGLVQKDDGVYVWVGTRAKDKPTWSGKLDQIAAGGHPVGLQLKENMVKEANEEADIPKSLAEQAIQAGAIHYAQQTDEVLDHSTIYVFDLWLPEDFVPNNKDGEVDSFELIPLEQLADITRETDNFKDNCNLVNIDLLLRQEFITEADPDFKMIKEQLYRQPLGQKA